MKTLEGEGEVDKYIDVLLLAIAAFMYSQISLLPTSSPFFLLGTSCDKGKLAEGERWLMSCNWRGQSS